MSRKQKRKAAQQSGAKITGQKSPALAVPPATDPREPSLLAQTLVLTNESTTKFDSLYRSYISRFKPADEVEMGFIKEMVAARWRQQRIWMIQTSGIELEMDRLEQQIEETMLKCSEPTRISIAFTWMANKEKAAELLTRCETTYSRMHDRAMKALRRLQEDRIQHEALGMSEEQVEIEPTWEMETTTELPAEPATPTTSEISEPEKQKLRNDPNSQSISLLHPLDQTQPEPPPARDNVCTEP